MKNKGKVYVGLSGGVDSAVSAALLQKEGYTVTGVFIKAWAPEWLECTWKEDRRSAMRVCAVLDIPFITLDLEKEYKEEVVDYMLREYKAGRTPNPDVMCNKEIKFGAFLKWALAHGADFVATGHYARLDTKGSPLALHKREPFVYMVEGADKTKDQSYFLWTLTQDQLKHILFPVGNLEKTEVRELARKFKLPQATRKDSQGLCFLGHVDMKEFLSRYVATKEGEVLDLSGKLIGKHNGAIFFTLGERHGFEITELNIKGPLYVVSKDMERNEITVSSQKSKVVNLGNMFELVDVNLNADLPLKCEARFRYRQEKLKCQIKQEGEKFYVEFENLEEEPASGQSVVFYDREVCLGGAVVE